MPRLDSDDYEGLANFRYLLRKFLRFSKDFLRAQRSAVKRFLRVYIEGIKLFKTDKEFSMETLGRYIKTSDREILAKTYDVYREAWETVPLVRREGIQQALDSIPEAKNAKLNLDT